MFTTTQRQNTCPRGISDHSPIWAEYSMSQHPSHLEININPWYLKIQSIREGITKATHHYFQENTGSVSSTTTLWEAYKSVIKGQALSLMAGHKKNKKSQMETLEGQLTKLELDLYTGDSPETKHLLHLKQQGYHDVATDSLRQHILPPNTNCTMSATKQANCWPGWINAKSLADGYSN